MQITSRFTIALHIFACIEIFGGRQKITSEFLAESIQVNPVIIRRILAQLKQAGLIVVRRGSGGASAARPYSDIRFYDVYRAVDCVEEGQLFHFHEHPNPKCSAGRHIHKVLDGRLLQVQQAMEDELKGMTLDQMMRDLLRCNSELTTTR